MKLKCLIVDDEPFAQTGMQDFITSVHFLELKDTCDDAMDALKALHENKIDLIFLDVQMPRLNGLDFLRSLPDPPMVILTTAYPEYALHGYELSVIDYLVKPISFERFTKAVNKAREYHRLQNAGHNAMEFFYIKTDKKLEQIRCDEMLYAEALSHYVMIYTENRKYITYLTLKNLEQQLPEQFLKIHKSYLVRLDKITSIDASGIYIKDKFVPVGKSFREQLNRKLDSKVIKRM